MKRHPPGFEVTRNGVPISDYALKDRINHGVTYGMSYAEWDAAIAAGATLTELMEWDRGQTFDIAFKEKVLAWHRLSGLIEAHIGAAAARSAEGK